MNNFYFILSFILFASSCSTFKVDKKRKISNNVVDLDKRKKILIPSIGHDHFSGARLDEKKHKRMPVICLVFGPGLNKTFLYAGVLKALEEAGPKIHMVTGYGMGLVFAGLYASSHNAKGIEWNIYKFLEKDRSDFFSQTWNENLKNELYQDINTKKIQNFSKFFLIPYLSKNNKRTGLIKKGEFGKLFREYAFAETFSAFPNDVFNIAELKNLGADFIIGVDLLGRRLKFIRPSGLLIGEFGKAISMQQKYKKDFHHILEIPASEMKLDGRKNLDLFLQKSYEYTRNELKIIKDKIAHWNSSSL